MRKVLSYDISEIEPYINWLYFYHAWGLNGKSQTEKERMKQEALQTLHEWEGEYHTHAIFGLFDANGDEDDILVYSQDSSSEHASFKLASNEQREKRTNYIRIPMLRQQKPSSAGEPNLCLADFLRPIQREDKGQIVDISQEKRDKLGMFCATVDGTIVDMYRGDEYQAMLAQTLCDRLAEATVERLHEEVRRHYWGYAPEEHLTIEQLHHEKFQGIRPAVGYPSIPDTSVNFILNEILNMGDINIRLTETGMMIPHASVSGLMFAHPRSRYFEVGKIGEDQLRDYARRRGIPTELMRHFLQSSLMKK